MATLVLSTVGTLLGGPVGGAIGSLVGQSIDQQLFGSPRRGPRLGDLSVQTSSYGTQIPRIYGRMRVAGSIIWSTDLVESTLTSGAKGQPDETYSYSVSFAVALSSRPVSGIGRIWADGKLLRGEGGDFKVSTEFRFYPGGEDQSVDPLIGSIEGSDSVPAFRGLAVAVFENLELAEFGNRIPFLTFEVIADQAPVAIAAILNDASAGRIDCTTNAQLTGYAALGKSMRHAVEPLVETFAIDLLDDGEKLRSPAGLPISLSEDALGCSLDGSPAPRMEREQTAARKLPSRLDLSFYDPGRDYQTGLVDARVGEQPGTESQIELPAVLDPADARSLVENNLARRWALRDKMVLRLAPEFLDTPPGAVVEIGVSPNLWQLQQCTIDGFVVIAELWPLWSTSPAISAESGRSAASADLVYGPVTLALIDIPVPLDGRAATAQLFVAASSPSSAWKAAPIEISAGGIRVQTRTALRKALLGESLGSLASGQAHLLDLSGSVDVQLIDPDQWLTSCDDAALVDGANLALLGEELVQFGDALPMGAGRFRLSRLLRGRLGTEWAMAEHAPGEPFVVIDPAALRRVPIPVWVRGSEVSVSHDGAVAGAITFDCEALKPLPPIDVRADASPSGLLLRWTRRSRHGWAWVDDVDAPIGESLERYSITVAGVSSSIERFCDQPRLDLGTSDLEALGAGPATISIRQIGDWGASRPATINLTLS
ncbi:MAG TPA: phage tail protein [Sphingomicrobium sp.]